MPHQKPLLPRLRREATTDLSLQAARKSLSLASTFPPVPVRLTAGFRSEIIHWYRRDSSAVPILVSPAVCTANAVVGYGRGIIHTLVRLKYEVSDAGDIFHCVLPEGHYVAAVEGLDDGVFGFSAGNVLFQGEFVLLADYVQTPDALTMRSGMGVAFRETYGLPALFQSFHPHFRVAEIAVEDYSCDRNVRVFQELVHDK